MPLDDCTLERMRYAAQQPKREDDDRHPAPGTAARLGEVVHRRDFLLLWGGEFVSLLGDQFFLVALPWLVLRLAGNALAIGTVLAAGAAPRTVFILLGGALIDRFSPRTVMLYTNLGRLALLAALALLTATGWVRLWMLYVFSLPLGLGAAFYLPAQSAMIPRLVPEKALQTGNAIIQGTAQLSLFIGPVVAGTLIAVLGGQGAGPRAGSAAAPNDTGIGLALALDAATFLVSAVTLALIRLAPLSCEESEAARQAGVLSGLAKGLAGVWRDTTLRHYFVLIAVVNLALLGPLYVGIPILADTRFRGGALAYGAILSGLGAGALGGVAAGGLLRRPSGRSFAGALLASVVALGAGLALLGALPSAAAATGAAFVIGVAEGYLTVQFITWLQLRTPKDELGRMMSILLFVSIGQQPVSNVIAGALIGLNATVVMIAAGGVIVVMAAIAALSPSVWRLGEEPAAEIPRPPKRPST